MRKDVKLGLAIGGVLLAMAVVFALFSSHPKTEVAAVDDQVETPENSTVAQGAVDATSKDTKSDAKPADNKPADVKPAAVAAPVTTADLKSPADAKNIVDVRPETAKTTPTETNTAVAGTSTPTDTAAADSTRKAKSDDTGAMFATTVTPSANDPHAAYGGGEFNTTDWDKTLATGVPKLVATATTPAPAQATVVQPVVIATAASPTGMATEPAHVQNPDADQIVSQAASPIATERSAVSSISTNGTTTHIVRSGDTFSTIAAAVYGNSRYYKLIAAANPGVDSSHLKLGEKLIIPARTAAITSTKQTSAAAASPEPTVDSSTQYRVQSGDSLHKICMKLYGDASKVDALYDANKAKIGSDPAKLKLGMILTLPAAPTAKATASR